MHTPTPTPTFTELGVNMPDSLALCEFLNYDLLYENQR